MDQKNDPPAEKSYNITFLLQNEELKVYENVFNDAFFQLLTSAAAIRNASLSSFQINDTIESTQKNFFYIIQNGYGVLRQGAEERGNAYYEFYDFLIQDYRTIFIVTLTLTILLLIASQIVIIPIVFRVHTINNQVLSLFGLIEMNELKTLTEKCEK